MTQKKPKNYVSIARKYAEDVVSLRIPACKWVQMACRRQLEDLDRKGWPYEFDQVKAARVCQFIEKLPHIKGEWAKNGRKIELQPWQIFILTTVFGWVSRETGLRRFRIVYVEVPRKNGKSTFSSGVALYCLIMDKEAGAEVYSAATTRDQAKIVWQDAWHMVERSPGLREAFGVSTTAHSISQIATASRFQALSAEGNSLDGLNIHCAVVDELHAHRSRKVYDVLETATGSRSQPLLWNITTAGSDRSGICYEQRDYLTKILQGVKSDDTYFGIIYTLDEGDNWQDQAAWAKANPNYGVSVMPDDIARLCEKAKAQASAQNNFLTKRLSVWVNADAPLFNVAKWEALGDKSLCIEQFSGEQCWVGVDLAPLHDFSAMALVFRRDEKYVVFFRHFLSEIEIEECGNSSYPGWAEEGWITTNPGNSTDYDLIEDELVSLQSKFDLQTVCYDPAGAKQILDHCQSLGLPMVEMRPIVNNFSEPTKLLDALISDRRIIHDGNPVAAWELSNVVGHFDRKDNVYPVKERPENKIDGIIALIMALARAMTGETTGSVYDSTEPVWIGEEA